MPRHFSRNKRMAEGIIFEAFTKDDGFFYALVHKAEQMVFLVSRRSYSSLTTINSICISVACLQALSDEAVLLTGASSPSQVDGDKPESLLRWRQISIRPFIIASGTLKLKSDGTGQCVFLQIWYCSHFTERSSASSGLFLLR